MLLEVMPPTLPLTFTDECPGCKWLSFLISSFLMTFTIVLHLKYTIDKPTPKHASILPYCSGVILVSDTFNDRVLRLDENGGPINIAGPSMSFRRPSALVELKDGSLAVICINFIAIFDAKGNYMKVLGKELLQKPYGEQRMRFFSHLYSCVQILSQEFLTS